MGARSNGIRKLLAAGGILGLVLTVGGSARAANQTVSGTVLHTSQTGAVGRNEWIASGGAVNGVSGYVFNVDPATVGKRFIVTLTMTSGFDDTNITFYSAFSATGATTCANYTFLNPSEAGRVCGVLAVVWIATGGPVAFTYAAGDGLAYGGIPVGYGTPNLSLVGRVDFTTGTDLAFEGDYAYVGSEDPSIPEGGLHIVDISDPTSPVQVGYLACPAVQNDVAVWQGIVAMAIDSPSSSAVCNPPTGAQGVRVVDARDPTNPVQIAFFNDVTGGAALGGGAHTVTTVGNTGYIYVNNNFGDRTDVIDLNPIFDIPPGPPVMAGSIGSIPDLACHDITVAGNRAYCAATVRTEIWDITDPLAPLILSRIVNPLINIHHSTAVEGDILVIGDEFTGAEAAFGCMSAGNAPTGALWFYDVSDEANPVPLGFFAPPEVYPGVRCTAHNFNIIPGENVVVSAFYKGGTRLIDFSDPANPVEVGFAVPEGAVTWSSYFHDGYVFTGDMHRGMDVLAITGITP
jgi:hypothetical protein